MDARKRRELAAAGRRLKARVTISGGALSDGAAEQVRRALATQPLLKVRVNTTERTDADAVAAALAERTGCEVVERLGFVLLLHREPADDGE